MPEDSTSAQSNPKLTSDNSTLCDYQTTVKTLNSLQTITLLSNSRKKQENGCSTQHMKLVETEKYLSRSGISLQQLDTLSVVHVAGTKGKGSTCAFCESILRHKGFKTGFYSSPHLVSVRERIRINGEPLSEDRFSKYFWSVYNALYEKKEDECDMPTYFKFLTVMAFNIFILEKVDVAIIEVGIGGENDCTNVLRKVPVIGITSLGMDHMNMLGETIEEITRHKSGIFKPNAAAFTVLQPPNVLDILLNRAAERKCILKIVPPLEEYDWEEVGVKLIHPEHIQTVNASLALQLANAWLNKKRKESENHLHTSYGGKSIENNYSIKAPTFPMTSEIIMGLCKCSWPGRFQVFSRGSSLFFLDGAHTVESINECSLWFLNQQERLRKCTNILLFNAIGKRDVLNLLNPLMKCNFDVAIFCPNVVERSISASSDLADFKASPEKQQSSAINIQKLWNSLHEDSWNSVVTEEQPSVPESISDESFKIHNKSYNFPCLVDAITFIEKQTLKHNNRTNVLVTGSLHLVGCVLSILDPDLSISSQSFILEKNFVPSQKFNL